MFSHKQNEIRRMAQLKISYHVNSLRPRRNGRYSADDIFKCIFLRKNVWIPTMISLKFVPKGPINNIPALVQIMACRRRRPGDKPLSEPMMVSLLTHICVTQPQWVTGKRQWYSCSSECIKPSASYIEKRHKTGSFAPNDLLAQNHHSQSMAWMIYRNDLLIQKQDTN